MIRIHQQRGNVRILDPSNDRVDFNARSTLTADSARDGNFARCDSQPKQLHPLRSFFVGEPGVGVPSCGAHDPGQVRSLYLVVVNEDEVPDAEPCEHLSDKGSSATQSDDADLLAAQQVLSAVAEKSCLAVVALVGAFRANHLWYENTANRIGHDQFVENGPLSRLQPELARDGVLGKH